MTTGEKRRSKVKRKWSYARVVYMEMRSTAAALLESISFLEKRFPWDGGDTRARRSCVLSSYAAIPVAFYAAAVRIIYNNAHARTNTHCRRHHAHTVDTYTATPV